MTRKFILGTVNLTHYPWLVRYWTLERNLSLPLCLTKTNSNLILNTYYIHRCISHLSAKRFLFAEDRDNYRSLQLIKMQIAREFGVPNPSWYAHNATPIVKTEGISYKRELKDDKRQKTVSSAVRMASMIERV